MSWKFPVQWSRPGAEWHADALVRRCVNAVCRLGERDLAGVPLWPTAVTLHLEVASADPRTVERLVSIPSVESAIRDGLINRVPAAAQLPAVDFRVTGGPTDRVRAVASTCARLRFDILPPSPDSPWSWAATSCLPADDQTALLVGRGPHHGGETHLPNDLVLPGEARFITRALGELRRFGAHWVLHPTGSVEGLRVRRHDGRLRHSDPFHGTFPLHPHDRLELFDDDARGLLVVAFVPHTEA